MPVIAVRVAAIVFGIGVVVYTLMSAVRSFVMPRSAQDAVTRSLFIGMRVIFNLWARPLRTFEARDQVMALYAPLSLVLLPGVWLVMVTLGYTAVYWGAGVQPLHESLRLSISSVMTLGFVQVSGLRLTAIVFSEAAIGLVLVALLISYLPAMYGAFSRREALVSMLEVRAGAPPTAVEMLSRFHRLKRMQLLSEMWVIWEGWFAELEETHTSLAALSFFRSPRAHRSWITAAGAILDTAALAASTLDIPHDVQADICIRSGFVALRHIADYFNIPHDADPRPTDPISITRQEYDEVCAQLETAGIALKTDRDQAWRDFAGWRVNYDTALLALASLVMAPYAPWSSDRSPIHAVGWVMRQRKFMKI
jgi:hypothetical protein